MGKVGVTPSAVATAFSRSPLRRARQGLADLVAPHVARGRDSKVPHPIAWRLRQRVYARPPEIAVYPVMPEARFGTRALLVSHDLSASGAPQLLVEVAQTLKAGGFEVTLASPTDGPLRAGLIESGISVIIDPTLHDPDAPLLQRLGANVDAAICNTVETAAAVRTLSASTHVIWYLHEVSLLRERLAMRVEVGQALDCCARVWAGSTLAGDIVRPVRDDVEIVPYGLDPIGTAPAAGDGSPVRPLRVGIFASIELRKGQDLLLAAMRLLPDAIRGQLQVVIYGRSLDADFRAGLLATAADMAEVSFGGELDGASYRAAMLACDAVCVPSRDDTLPLVSLDALGAGRVLMCTATTGTASYLDEGASGFVAASPDPEAIAAMLERAVLTRDRWPLIGVGGRAVFDRAFSRAPFAAILDDAVRWATRR